MPSSSKGCIISQGMHTASNGGMNMFLAVPCRALLFCPVQALVDVLQQGGCSELISLDLRGNMLSADAQALLVRLNYSLVSCACRTAILGSCCSTDLRTDRKLSKGYFL